MWARAGSKLTDKSPFKLHFEVIYYWKIIIANLHVLCLPIFIFILLLFSYYCIFSPVMIFL